MPKHVMFPGPYDDPELAGTPYERLEAENSRLRAALLRDPSDGTCRLCGGAPTDERKLCEPCFDDLKVETDNLCTWCRSPMVGHPMTSCVGEEESLFEKSVRWLDAHGLDKPGQGLRQPLAALLASVVKEAAQHSKPQSELIEEWERQYLWAVNKLRWALGVIRTWDMLNPPAGAPEPLSDGPFFRKMIDEVLARTLPHADVPSRE